MTSSRLSAATRHRPYGTAHRGTFFGKGFFFDKSSLLENKPTLPLPTDYRQFFFKGRREPVKPTLPKTT